MGFWHNWAPEDGQGYKGGRFREIPLADVDPAYNVIAVSFMKGAGIPTFKPYKGSDAEFRSAVDTLHAHGRVVLISLGGADAHIQLQAGDTDALAEEIIRLVDVYGFDGLDIDLEQNAITAGANIDVIPEALKQVKDRLKAQGRHFIISMAPEFPYLAAGRDYLPYLHKLDGHYDFIAPQFYNQGGDGVWDPEGNAGAGEWLSQDKDEGTYKRRFLVALTKALLTGTNGYTKIDPSRFVIGLPSNVDAAATGYSTDAGNVSGALQDLADAGLAIRGLMTWSVNWDLGQSAGGVSYGGEFAERYGYLTGGDDGQRPPAPTGLHAEQVGITECMLGWNAVAGAVGYRVYRNDSLVASPSIHWVHDADLAAGTVYRYQVTAVDAEGRQSAKSPVLEIRTQGGEPQLPEPPTGLRVVSTTHSVVTLAWIAARRNMPARRYRVERDGKEVATVDSTGYADSGLEPDTTYAYAVYSIAEDGSASLEPAQVQARTQPAAGTQPWTAGATYEIGQVVLFEGLEYACIARHTAKREWTPRAATTLWSVRAPSKRLQLRAYKGRKHGIAPFHGGVIQPASRAALEFGPDDWKTYSLEAGKCYPAFAMPAPGADPDQLKYQDDPSVEPPADGEIASGGFAEASVLDRADIQWPCHEVVTGQLLDVYWNYRAEHASRRWRYWMTRADWDPAQPLSRASFDPEPFHIVQLEAHPHWEHSEELWPAKPTHHQVRLPVRVGRHALLAVWDVANTGNAFFQVIDLHFEGDVVPHPPVPINVRIGATTTSTIEVLWDRPTDAGDVEHYRVYRGGSLLVQIPGAPLRHVDAGLAANTEYQYSITLVVDGVESPHSALVTGRTSDDGTYHPPGAPSHLHPMKIEALSVGLMWTPSSGGSAQVQNQVLFRDGDEIARTDGKANQYTDTGVQPLSRYQYFAAAIDAKGTWSVPSNVPWVETLGDEGGGEVPEWSPNSVRYAVGDRVRYGDSTIYRCLQAHTSNSGWTPVEAFTLWQPERAKCSR